MRKQNSANNVTLFLTLASSLFLFISTVAAFGPVAFANRTARNDIRGLRVEVLEGKITTRAAFEKRLNEIENKKGAATQPTSSSQTH